MDQIISSWHERAAAYDNLLARYSLFTVLADRLIDALPESFSGHCLDIAGGSGLLSARLLLRHPDAKISLIEPADNMRALAKARLGNGVDLYAVPAEELDSLELMADAAVCSAAFHLMDATQVLPAVAQSLAPGGLFACNIWGHSFDETAGQEKQGHWIHCVETALIELGEKPHPRPAPRSPRLRSKKSLAEIAGSCGMALVKRRISTDSVPLRFNIEFAAMSSRWLNYLGKTRRRQVIQRALELCTGSEPVVSVDLLFVKQGGFTRGSAPA